MAVIGAHLPKARSGKDLGASGVVSLLAGMGLEVVKKEDDARRST